MGNLMSRLKLPARKLGKRTLGIVLSVALLASAIVIGGMIPSSAVLNVDPATPPPSVYFYAPETIYVNPMTNQTQWYANSYASASAGATWGSVTANGRGESANGYVSFNCAGATDIVLTRNSGPAGYAPTITQLGTATNAGFVLSAGTAAANAGLVRWKATYKVGGINYTSYCYSYIYVPDTRAISGSTTHIYDGSDSGNGAYSRGDVGMFIIGAHYNTVPAGGSYSAGTAVGGLMQTRLWGGWPSGEADRWVSGSGGTATNNLLSSGTGITYASVNDGTSDSTYTNRIGSTTGGLSYISVDTSRYDDLNQIPQIRAVMVIARARIWWGSNGDGTVVQGKNGASGWTNDTGLYGGSSPGTPNGSYVENMGSTASPGVNSLPAVGVGSGNYANSAEIYRAKLASAPISDGANSTATVFGSYHWHWESSGLTWGRGACIHQNGARIQGEPVNKGNLRSELQAQIQSGLQYDGMRGEVAYRSALESLALALCKPDHVFDSANDLGAGTQSNSLAGQVRIAAANLEAKNGQAEAGYRNAMTGGIIPMYVTGNNVSYELGESVTADYDAALDVPPGYDYPPVAVSVPYVNGSGVVVTDTAAPGVPAVANTAVGRYTTWTGTRAPNSAQAPNTNIKVARLNWVWWLQPITYKLRLEPGDGTGTPYEITLYYGQEYTLPNALAIPPNFTGPAGSTFVGWKFTGGELQNGVYGAGEKVKNLTASKNATITAVAQWIGGMGSTFVFNFGNLPGTTITNFGSGTNGGGGLVNFAAPAGSLVSQLGTWPQGNRTGYDFGGWFFDNGSWFQPLSSYSQSDVASTTRMVYARWIPYYYRINYGANTGTGPPPAAHVNVDWDSTVNALVPEDLTKAGYEFVGWSVGSPITNTSDPLNGLVRGVDYFMPGDPMTNLLPAPPTNNNGSITLYAIWKAKPPVPFIFNFGTGGGTSVTNLNGGTDIGNNQVRFTVPAGSKVADLPTWPAGSRTGYDFGGWFFDNGSWMQPLAYYAQSEVESTSGMVYARWIPFKYRITYGANTSVGTPPPAHTDVDWDSSVTLLPPDDLTKQGYDFVGWSKGSAITAGPNPLAGLTQGVDYFLPGDVVSNLLPAAPTNNTGSITLYAMWQAKTPTVKFYENWHDWTSIEAPAPTGIYATQIKYYGGTYDENIDPSTRVITASSFPADPARFGWTFGGWYTVANPPGTGLKIENISQLNQAFQAGDHNLYAFWITGSTVPVTVTLNPGAADATLPTQSTPGVTQNLTRGQGSQLSIADLALYKPTRPGYTFNGWTIDSIANAMFVPSNGTTYVSGDTGVLLNANTVLTAQWVETVYTVRYNANYVGDVPSDDNPDPSPDPVPAYVDGGTLKILTAPTSETAATLTRTGYTLLGYAYQATATTVDFTTLTPTVAAMLTGTGNTGENNGTDPSVILNVYALWEAKGGDTGGDGDDDTDDDTADDGVILLRYTVPAGVTLVPAAPTFKYLTYDQPYGTLASATKPGNANFTYNFVGWKVIQCGGSEFNTPLLGEKITSDTICKHEYTIWVEPVFADIPVPPPLTCCQRIQACLTNTRNKIIKFFFPLLSLGLPLLNYGIPNLTVEKVFELPFHTLFLACVFGCVVFPIFLIVPSWFTVIHELAPSWWPNVKRFYLL